MFDRKKFKRFALIQLKNRWTLPILMTLITGIVFAVFQIPSFVDMWTSKLPEVIISGDPSSWEMVADYEPPASSNILELISSICIFVFTVAQIHVYLIMSRGPEPVAFTEFFGGFNLWLKAILTGIWNALWIFIWSLLFVIPGIVKSIAYSQMFFIVTEYPNISARKAMRISIAITHGHKAELFMMALSFLGWILVSLMTGGIGFLWLIPYMQMTSVNAYHWLMKQALETNIITLEDLGVNAEQL